MLKRRSVIFACAYLLSSKLFVVPRQKEFLEPPSAAFFSVVLLIRGQKDELVSVGRSAGFNEQESSLAGEVFVRMAAEKFNASPPLVYKALKKKIYVLYGKKQTIPYRT